MTGRAYGRRVSTEEAREGYILVLKNRLTFFPRDGGLFTLTCGGASVRTHVEAVSCVCRRPEKPHEHYFVRWPGLRTGQRVVIEESEPDAGADATPRYRLTIS